MSKTKIYHSRTYRLSEDSIQIIERLAEEFSNRLGSHFSMNRVVDSIISYCKDVTFTDIANKNIEHEEETNE